MSVNDIPVAVVMGVIEELKTTLVRLDEKIDAKLGDHATRIARIEVQREDLQRQVVEMQQAHQRQLGEMQQTHQRQIGELQTQLREATNGRRWGITTLIAVVAVLVAIGSLVAAILGG